MKCIGNGSARVALLLFAGFQFVLVSYRLIDVNLLQVRMTVDILYLSLVVADICSYSGIPNKM